MSDKPTIAIHKFTSDDGCQLAFLNAGEELITISELVEIVHFAEAGISNIEAPADITFIEGSISTPDEKKRLMQVRANSKYLITIGACATAGGIQALRNFANHKEWMASVYANPEFIETLATSTPIADHVYVDLELWGCPVNTQQIITALRALLFGVTPRVIRDSVCLECKRKGNVCVLVTKKMPCMGPVTQLGCGALCPSVGRACYACYGPSENPNTHSLGKWFTGFGLMPDTVTRYFWHINNQAKAFKEAGGYFKGIKITIKE
ncbi:MAG: sulfhydrogenase subunit delta [Burkholderiales bacterium]